LGLSPVGAAKSEPTAPYGYPPKSDPPAGLTLSVF